MLFNSYSFLIFFPIVVLVYFLIPHRVRHIWLLIASYYFYMNWSAKYALLLLFSTVVTYLSGMLIAKAEHHAWWEAPQKQRMKKCFVAASLILNLGVLFVFKYLDFAVETVNKVSHLLGQTGNLQTFSLVLPVGISFYTFQALSYTMDVYRGEIDAEKNFLKYALFVSFFPQLVAGPIERSKNLLNQLSERHTFDYKRVCHGLQLMLWGYFLKLVLADRIALFVDTVFSDTTAYAGCYAVLASILFAFQIYCDFAGYSTIAIGAAQVMGFRLMENFNCPYFGQTVAEFWRRWHISLTSWFRDYLYIPLGGNRKGKLRKYVNVMIVFLISGLWHGASWSFVAWGGLNGLYQVIGEIIHPAKRKIRSALHVRKDAAWLKALRIVITFILVDFAWIFFRAHSGRTALAMIKGMLTVHNWSALTDGSIFELGLNRANAILLLVALAMLLIADLLKYRGTPIRQTIDVWVLPVRWIIYMGAVLFVLVFGIWGNAYEASGFIYFQF